MPRKSLLFFIAVIVSVVLMTYQNKSVLGRGVSLFDGLLSYAHSSATSISDGIKSPFRKIALRDEENKTLKKQIAGLMLERQKYQEVLAENRRLKELLSFREKEAGFVTAARIIARGIDGWGRTIVIDRGERDGVAKDMAAVTPRGLAGKVTVASGAHSSVLLLTDINFSAGVRFQDGRREGVVSGTGSGKCVLKYIPYEYPVKAGEVIVTSGLDRLFPPGIPVGYVSRVTSGGAGAFQNIDVIPFQDDAVMEEVIIVR